MRAQNFDPFPVVRLFEPDGWGSWLLAFTYPNDPDLAYGLVDPGCVAYADMYCACQHEFGDVRISELKALRGLKGYPIERDTMYQTDRPLSGYFGVDRLYQ